MYGWYYHPMSGAWWAWTLVLSATFVTLLVVGLTSLRRARRESSHLATGEGLAGPATERFTYGLSAQRHTRRHHAHAREHR